MLNNHQQQLWGRYLFTEGRGTRAEKLETLEVFLNSLTTVQVGVEAQWYPWARSIAEEVVDGRLNLVIRTPLFERAIFPALYSAYKAELPGSVRLLASLADNLDRCRACRRLFPDGDSSELALLQLALWQDPNDSRSRLRLIRKIELRFYDSLHELPSGVLYGMDGATAENCMELSSELEFFDKMVGQEGLEKRYAELIKKCKRHFTAYRYYLFNRDSYESYADYLEQNPE